MQRRYSEEFKESVVKRMMPPNPVSVSQLVEETGVSDVTLYKWMRAYRDSGIAVPGDNSKPAYWSAEDKLAVVIETAAMNEVQTSEYCRSKGLYVEQLEQWKSAALAGYQNSEQVEREKARSREDDKRKSPWCAVGTPSNADHTQFMALNRKFGWIWCLTCQG